MAYRGDLKLPIVERVFDMVSEGDKTELSKLVGSPMNFKGVVSTLPDSNRCNQRKRKLS